MRRSQLSEERIAYALRHTESGTPVGDVWRQVGVSEATFQPQKTDTSIGRSRPRAVNTCRACHTRRVRRRQSAATLRQESARLESATHLFAECILSTARPRSATRTHNLQLLELLEGIEVAVAVEQGVVVLDAERGNEAVDGLSNGPAPRPQMPVVLRRTCGEIDAAGHEDLESLQVP